MTDQAVSNPDPQNTSNYRKRPFWQWLVVYLLIGLVLYGGVYYFMTKKNSEVPIATETASEEETQAAPENGSSSNPEDAVNKVYATITQDGFDPQSLTIEPGTMVVWTNKSGVKASIYSADHPTHEVYPLLNLGEFENNETLSLIFTETGAFEYHNHLKPTQTGTVTVQ